MLSAVSGSPGLGEKFLNDGEFLETHPTSADAKYNPSTENDPTDEEDEFRTLAEIARANGFIFEDHWVTTSDGYILSLMRIPGI